MGENMKGVLFARPNLKVFLLAALVIVFVQDFLTNGRSPNSAWARSASAPSPTLEECDLETLLRLAATRPSSQVYFHISDRYQRLGDDKRARLYLLRAEARAEEEAGD
jgi:hypothetical protein